MLRDRNIAFFIDVDNVGLKSENYANILEQLNGMGTVLTGKVYGAGERKHKEIYDDAELRGYRMERPMRIKRRGRKDFDARIFVDVVDAVNKAPAIDAVCIIAESTDLVYLYSYLHSRGIKIIALDNADEASNAFIDEVIDSGLVVELKLPKTKPATKTAAKPAEEPASAPVKEQPQASAQGIDRTDELLKEIERLRSLAATPAEEPKAEPVAKPAPVEEPVVEAPAAEPAQEKAAPRAAYTPANDSDLIRRIEDLRRTNSGDDEDFIDEIRKLLDGLE